MPNLFTVCEFCALYLVGNKFRALTLNQSVSYFCCCHIREGSDGYLVKHSLVHVIGAVTFRFNVFSCDESAPCRFCLNSYSVCVCCVCRYKRGCKPYLTYNWCISTTSFSCAITVVTYVSHALLFRHCIFLFFFTKGPSDGWKSIFGLLRARSSASPTTGETALHVALLTAKNWDLDCEKIAPQMVHVKSQSIAMIAVREVPDKWPAKQLSLWTLPPFFCYLQGCSLEGSPAGVWVLWTNMNRRVLLVNIIPDPAKCAEQALIAIPPCRNGRHNGRHTRLSNGMV